ncbi:hypothetical protein T08_202 [Trichinella sp. T8]|nr:hypothetical protein T08_202 [Trichinella sp. T8]
MRYEEHQTISEKDGLLDVSVKWSTHIEGHFPLLESSTPVDDQITDSSSVRRCTVAGYRAGKQKKQPKSNPGGNLSAVDSDVVLERF